MTSFFILICLLTGLIVIGTLFYLQKGQSRPEEKPDTGYICNICDDKDCFCHKRDPKFKG